MKKVLLFIVVVFGVLLTCGCSEKHVKPQKTAIIQIDDFKWGMTKDEVINKIIDKKYVLKRVYPKSIKCEKNNKSLKYEIEFTFKDGYLANIDMETRCSEPIFDDMVKNAKNDFDKSENISEPNMPQRTVSYLFKSKTTDCNYEYIENAISPKKEGTMRIFYGGDVDTKN